MAEARELDAALVELQRRLERQVAFFELLDDGLELGDRRLEVLDRGIQVVIATGFGSGKRSLRAVGRRRSTRLAAGQLAAPRRSPSTARSPARRWRRG